VIRCGLTPLAQADVDDIVDDTLEHWGADQMVVYVRDLERKFAALAEAPGLGRRRPEIGDGIRSIPEGSHMIYYRQTGDRLEILRIIHQSMDTRGMTTG
jgi:toxin ParE1/3/4